MINTNYTNSDVHLLVGDVIVGKILAGNNLHIESQATEFESGGSPQFIVEHNGVKINNAALTMTRAQAGVTNRIILDPIEGFSIYRGTEKQVFIGADGNVNFQGAINGGSININDRFRVDSQGNASMSGSIGLGARTGNPNVFNPDHWNFHVNPQGRTTTRDLHITGGSLTIGRTTVDEWWFTTQNGWGCSFFSSFLDGSNSIDGMAVQVGTLLADRIRANSITANEIAAGTITAREIMANTITGNEIAANTITTQHLQAGAISTNKIASLENPGNTLMVTGSGSFADLEWSQNGRSLFLVRDQVDGAQIRLANNTILTAMQGFGSVTAEGQWRFVGWDRPTINGDSIATVSDLIDIEMRLLALEEMV